MKGAIRVRADYGVVHNAVYVHEERWIVQTHWAAAARTKHNYTDRTVPWLHTEIGCRWAVPFEGGLYKGDHDHDRRLTVAQPVQLHVN